MRADSARHWAQQMGGSTEQRVTKAGWATRIAADTGVPVDVVAPVVESLTVPINVEEAAMALADETPVGGPVFSDDFTGTNGAAWNPAKWSTYGTEDFDIEINSNQGQMAADGTGATSNANASAVLNELLADLRMDFDVTIPASDASTGRFFYAVALRIEPTTEPATPDYDGYRFLIARTSGTGTPVLRILREVGGVQTQLGSDVTLSNSILQYSVRFQVQGEELKAAVRDFSTGPIEEDDWDLEETDNVIGAAGTVRPRLVKVSGDGVSAVLVDNVVISVAPS